MDQGAAWHGHLPIVLDSESLQVGVADSVWTALVALFFCSLNRRSRDAPTVEAAEWKL